MKKQEKTNIYVIVYDIKTGKTFKKYFKTEFERDKYIRKSKYFTNLIVKMPNDVELLK